MKSFFDQFKPALPGFVPRTAAELFVLRLAQKLGDASGVRHYVELADRHSEGQMLFAYRRSLGRNGAGNRWRRFHHELERAHRDGNHDDQTSLISIRVERRAVAAAVFRGRHLEYTDARQLSSVHDRALDSAVGFITWMLDRFPVESATFESILHGQEIHRRVLHDAICGVVRNRLLPIWEMPRLALLEGCADPALKSRAQLREIATSVWPVLGGTNAKVYIQDAAILGLHIQTERLFFINPDLS